MKQWMKSGKATKDGVHFTHLGYQQLGRQMADDIISLSALNSSSHLTPPPQMISPSPISIAPSLSTTRTFYQNSTVNDTLVIDYSHLPSNALTAASVRKFALPKLAA